MIKHNELVLNGKGTSSFPFKVLVEDRPSVQVPRSKTQLLDHRGLSGAIVQTNKHRDVIEKPYRLYLIGASEKEVNEFSAYLMQEGFWLESERLKLTRFWCYRTDSFDIKQDDHDVYVIDVTFICHPTRFFKSVDRQVFSANGVLKTQGSALAFPTITITGQSVSETSFTVGDQVIRIEKFTEPLVMVNHPDRPSFKTLSGKAVKWSGDFITIDASHPTQSVGVILGSGILSLTFETNWGWV